MRSTALKHGSLTLPVSARDGLWQPIEPEWLREQAYTELMFLRNLREPEEPEMTVVAPIVPNAVEPSRMLRPVAPIAEVIEQQSELRSYIAKALKEDRDYGLIPGVKKPSLLKPGAERINTAYGVMPRFSILSQEVDHHAVIDWRKNKKYGEAESGTSYGLYAYTVRCELVNRATGEIVADCIGACSSMESKYIDRPRDSQNTVLKMAEKRAYVGATLLAYGLSDQFTQDVEETGVGAEEPATGGIPSFRSGQTSSGTGRSVEDKTMPFGKTKGKRLGELTTADLSSTLSWCKGKDAAKFADLIDAIEQVLDNRRTPVNQDLSEPLPASVTAPDVDDELPFN